MNIQTMHQGPMRRDSIRIDRAPTGHGYRLEASQWLPHPREEVFDFFCDAFQLEALTPPWMHFSVLTPAPIHMGNGALIDYRLKVHGIPLRWQSFISSWEPPVRFVDVQMRGPYRRWRHQHTLEAVENGALCRDIVDYAVYGGSLVNALFVRPDLFKIFAFRQSKLRELFSTIRQST
jgi:ligand-binding SRPBCC domain-containing protein